MKAPFLDYQSAAATIEAFVDGKSDLWDWDDFTSIKKKDAFLESVRTRCISIRDEYPPKKEGSYCDDEGFAVLRSLARELRSRTKSLTRRQSQHG